jgi:acyl-CoA synthetase (AMP-forming)/AMP-acid ligase II
VDFPAALLEHLTDSSTTAAVGPGGDSWTGAELLARAGGAAHWLDSLDVPAGHPIPALLDNSPAALALALAGALSDRPMAPLSTRTTVEELVPTVAALDTEVLLCEPASAELGRAVAERAHLRLLVAPSLPAADRDWTGQAGQVAAVLHTSGTTGAPHAVPMAMAPLAARSAAYAQPSRLGAGDLFCSGAPLHHVSGLGMALVAWSLGAGVATLPWFSVAAWRWVQQVRPSHVLLVPSMIEMLLTARQLDAGMRTVIYGAAPIHPDTLVALVKTLPAATVLQVFGQTEVSPVTALTHAEHLDALAGNTHLLTSVGRPINGLELRLEGQDGGGIGEVTIRAAHAFTTDVDGWHRTGDLARQDEAGYLYLAGRRGDMVIRGGENVYPVEVERVLERHSAIREVVVVGVPDRRLGEVLRAVVVPVEPAEPPAIDDLRAFARAALPGFKVPDQWSFMAELPRTPSGKLLRRLLVAP